MSGHSKWATIKRKKGAVDAKKGQVFTKLVREITTSARMGGGDPNGNPRLRAAIAEAKANRMPADNIDRAIKKGTGDLDGPPVEEISYEGYAPGGVAVFIEVQTDNRNRSISEVRSTFTKGGGTLGAAGSGAWMCHKKGHITFYAKRYTEEQLMDVALDAGAEDVTRDGDTFIVVTDLKSFGAVLDQLDKKAMTYESAALTMVPETYVKVSGESAEKMMRFLERLEELDDVQKAYANFDIDDSELERIASAS